jgi:hypothetical protein
MAQEDGRQGRSVVCINDDEPADAVDRRLLLAIIRWNIANKEGGGQ